MYICPICNRKFKNEEDIARHSLQCWREKNPFHKSKPAPHSEEIVERQINDEVSNFFSSLEKRI